MTNSGTEWCQICFDVQKSWMQCVSVSGHIRDQCAAVRDGQFSSTESSRIRSTRTKIELHEKQKDLEERNSVIVAEMMPEATQKANQAEDRVEKSLITAEMIAAAGDDMEEVRQAMEQTEVAAKTAQGETETAVLQEVLPEAPQEIPQENAEEEKPSLLETLEEAIGLKEPESATDPAQEPAENAKIVLEFQEVHLQSVRQAISSRRSSNSIEEGCWCFQYTQPLTPHSPLVTTTTTTTKSWRSDTLIILPGWECHTGGSRSKPTVHRCSQSGRRLWVARQVHIHEPNGSAAVRQCQHVERSKKNVLTKRTEKTLLTKRTEKTILTKRGRKNPTDKERERENNKTTHKKRKSPTDKENREKKSPTDKEGERETKTFWQREREKNLLTKRKTTY